MLPACQQALRQQVVLVGKHVNCTVKKIRKSIEIVRKIQQLVSQENLVSFYYSLVCPFLIYGLIAQGNAYEPTLKFNFFDKKRSLGDDIL